MRSKLYICLLLYIFIYMKFNHDNIQVYYSLLLIFQCSVQMSEFGDSFVQLQTNNTLGAAFICFKSVYETKLSASWHNAIYKKWFIVLIYKSIILLFCWINKMSDCFLFSTLSLNSDGQMDYWFKVFEGIAK